MDLIDRFLKYVSFDTQSSETSGTHPSSAGQLVLARVLVEELRGLGAREVFVSEGGSVYATIPASLDRTDLPALGFLAHMDTSPDASGANVKPRRVAYAGGVLPLGTSGRALDPKVFPELDRLVGKELIVTDGTTLLGADDKIGLAVLVALAADFVGRLPAAEAPESTEGREGFYHPHAIEGSVSEATLQILIRDHNADRFAVRKAFLSQLVGAVNAKVGTGTAQLTIKDQYTNMEARLKEVPELVAAAKAAGRAASSPPCWPPAGSTCARTISADSWTANVPATSSQISSCRFPTPVRFP